MKTMNMLMNSVSIVPLGTIVKYADRNWVIVKVLLDNYTVPSYYVTKAGENSIWLYRDEFVVLSKTTDINVVGSDTESQFNVRLTPTPKQENVEPDRGSIMLDRNGIMEVYFDLFGDVNESLVLEDIVMVDLYIRTIETEDYPIRLLDYRLTQYALGDDGFYYATPYTKTNRIIKNSLFKRVIMSMLRKPIPKYSYISLEQTDEALNNKLLGFRINGKVILMSKEGYSSLPTKTFSAHQ